MSSEIENIRARYARRGESSEVSARDDPLTPYNGMAAQEKQRALIRLIKRAGLIPVSNKTVLEIGCGSGKNLLQLIRLGFRPENLVGNELLEHRADDARHFLPAATRIIVGDAAELDLADESFDVVLQSTVFTSILDNAFQEKLAKHLWSFVKPGGGIVWYDYIYNNPWNPDVRGVPVSRIRELFPLGEFTVQRLTLAPPLGRNVTKISPVLYTILNVFPFLRTHVLCWIKKR